jgi:hypothetical protein
MICGKPDSQAAIGCWPHYGNDEWQMKKFSIADFRMKSEGKDKI